MAASLAVLMLASACTSTSGVQATSSLEAVETAPGSTSFSSSPSGNNPVAATAPPAGSSTASTPPSTITIPTTPSKIIPPVGGGDIHHTVAPITVATKSAVAVTAPADFGGDVSAKITEFKIVQAEAKGVGEVSGPAVQATVSITNGSSKPISLESVAVNVADKAGIPASQLTGDVTPGLSGTLAAGKQQTGVYIFSLPSGTKQPLTVSVSYSGNGPIVTFVGVAK